MAAAIHTAAIEISMTTANTIKLSQLRLSNHYANLGVAFGHKTTPQPFTNPKLIHVNPAVLALLGIDSQEVKPCQWATLGCGAKLLPGSQPLAMKYTGHQFGIYNPELGDGRALLLGEINNNGELWELHLKGAGKTPYSRFGDGRAVLRSTIREYLAGEALTALGINSTRALCLVGSDEPVQRETIETAAMLIRVARSHIRFGHFEYLFYTRQLQAQQELIKFTCARFLPEVTALPIAEQAEQLLRFSLCKTAEMVAGWQAVGFAHGVLNTDNMSIIGDSFDFGPYGFIDDYEPGFICNHSDHSGRYAFDNQPGVVLWNLNALAHALSNLVGHDKLRDCLAEFKPLLTEAYSARMRAKLGLQTKQQADQPLCADFLALLAAGRTDYTLAFRALSHYCCNQSVDALRQLLPPQQHPALEAWLQQYNQRLAQEPFFNKQRSTLMLAHNPKFILRNYLAQQVIEAAQQGDFQPLKLLFKLISKPFDEHPQYESWAAAPPESGKHLSISCSS